MSNFTRSGSRAKIWQSTSNLSCCSIGLFTKHIKSMKAFAFAMLFLFSIGAMLGQNLERSTFYNRCMSEAPPGPSEADIANLYLNQCNGIPATVVKSTFWDPESDDCDWFVEYSYDVKCGDFEESIKVEYLGGDRSAPTLEGELPPDQSNLNLCFNAIPAGPSAAAIAALYSDNCSDVFVEKSGTPTGNDCEWNVTYTYTVRDACFNYAEEVKIEYSGGDSEAPKLKKGVQIPTGASGLNLCFENKAQGPTAEEIAALFEDNCGNVTVTKTSDSKGIDCKWLAIYHYTIKDDCDNYATPITLQYSGGDSEVPVIDNPPADITVNCIDEIPNTPKILVTDNCATGIKASLTTDSSGLGIACEGGVLIRTWTATDNCTNSTSVSQTITVLPAPEAEFSDLPADKTISCAEADGYQPESLYYSNGVEAGACAINGEVQGVLSGDFTECGGGLTVTWSFEDECGRSITHVQNITVEPAPMAEFGNIPGDITISCEQAALYQTMTIGYSNGLDGECGINGEVQGVLSGSYTECGGTLYVDWAFTDDCQRTISAQKIITVSPAPQAEFEPVQNEEISCEEANTYAAGTLSYTNGGTGTCEISGEVQGVLSGSFTECGGTLYVDWKYTDNCDREIEAQKIITVLPAPMAEFESVENEEISCEDANTYAVGTLSYTNGGTEACLIAGEVQGVLSGSYDECGGTLYVDWKYTDDCDREIEAQKIITVLPAPMAEFAPVENEEISCEAANTYAAGSLSYTNGGTGSCEISGEVQGVLSGSYTECGGTLYVDWTYTDDCQRTIAVQKVITVLPAPMAEFAPVENEEISCEAANTYAAGSLSYTNGGTEACLIAGEVQGVLSGSFDECGGTLYVDWKYTDDCDREIEAQKIITVLPAPQAEFAPVENEEISCEAANTYAAGSLSYTNGGTEACLIAGEVQGVLSGSYDECGGTLYVDWTYTDDCDRTITAQKIITVLPAPMAEFAPVENEEISCEAANTYAAGSLSYTNNGTGACLIAGEVQGVLSGSYDECGGTLYVDWTYTDDCDREIEAQKIITVLPAPQAEFAPVQNEEISCEDANTYAAGTLSYTNGGTEACLIAGEVQGVLSGSFDECGGTLYVDWKYTDDCDREIEAQKIITVLPAPMAEFAPVENEEISCEAANTYAAGTLSYTNGGTEACLIAGEVQGVLSGSYTECGGTLYVDWTYTDDCQRTIAVQKVITVLPAPMAEFAPVENEEISCEAANTYAAGSLSYTNNGTGACLIAGEVQGVLSGTFDECGGTLYVDWKYTDDCDREIEAQKVITVLPAPQAQFEDVDHVVISCEEANTYAAGTLSYTNSGTGACLIAGEVQGVLSGEYTECGGLLFVDWTYTDDCDRTITATQQIKVEPAPQAEFAPVENEEISCEAANTYAAGSLSYTNGGTEACLIAGEVQGVLSGSYDECGGTLYVDWTYTDDCDRTITAQKIITVLPAPMAEFAPVENEEISCEAANTYAAGSLSYTNGGTEACLIAGEVQGVLSGSFDECGGTLYVDWTYTDDCDRTITAQKVITVLPAPMAEFAPVENEEISCEDANTYAAGTLSYTNGGTEACLIAGEVQGVLSGSFDECGGTLYVDWKYTDDCDREIEAQKIITVLPAPMAEFAPVENEEISCEAANTYAAGTLSYTNGGTEACLIAGEVQGVLSGSYTECGGTLYVDWTYTDDCQRTIAVQKVITVLPAPQATFEAVQDETITCEEANLYEATSLSYTNGGTGVCEISGSVEGVLSGTYSECGGTLYVDWKYTDDCDREIEAQKIITVLPAPMAEFAPVENEEISCEAANVYEASSLSYTNGGTSVCEISGEVQGVLSGSYDECGGTLYVDWTYTDDCDRTITAQKVITVLPAPMAEFAPVENEEISCEAANTYAAGSLSYTNDGTGACLIAGEVQGVLSGSFDECGGTLYVDWKYTDDCDREIEAQKIITVLPAPMAHFAELEDDTIACEDLASYVPEFLSYTNEGTGGCVISGEVQGVADAFDGSCGQFEVNFTFTDDCDRTITYKQLITVIDETAPVLTGVLPQGESNLDLCFDNRPTGPTIEEIAALFEDNCGNVNVTKEEITPEENDCHWAVLYRYTVQDDCGNFAAPVKVYYNGEDQSAPVLTGTLPEGVTGLQCMDENPGGPRVSDLEELYTDNCGTVIITELDPIITGDDCGWTATYTFTVEDACGNFADNIVITNSGADTTPPTLEGTIPMGANSLDLCIDSDLGEPSEEDIAALYSDNCGGPITVTKIEKVYGTDCEWIRVFEYQAKDACNNVADLVKVNYQGGDDSAPEVIENCEESVMLLYTENGASCPEDADTSLTVGDVLSHDTTWLVAGLTVNSNATLGGCISDNCASVDELTFTVAEIVINKDDSCQSNIKIYFDIEDNCENVLENFVCEFVIIDNTAPVVTCPEDQDFGLNPALDANGLPIGLADKASYTDNCQDPGLTQDFSDAISSVLGEGGANYTNRLLTSEADFSGDETLLDFEGFSNLEQLTTQYAAQGAEFSAANGEPRVWNTNSSVSVSGIGWLNNWRGTPDLGEAVTIDFASIQNRVGFYVKTNDADNTDIEVICMHNGNVVGTTTFTTGLDVTFIGLESSTGFDRIIYSGVGNGNSVVQIDDLRFEGGGSASRDYTLVRTFTANDGCDNTATCDVVYTWSIAEDSGSSCGYELVECGSSVTGNTTGGTPELVNQPCTSIGNNTGDWYTFIGTGDNVVFSTCSANTSYDTYLSAYTDCGETCVENNDDNFNCGHSIRHSSITISTVEGQEYNIYVSGFNGITGAYELSVDCEVLFRQAQVELDFTAYPVPFDKEVNIAYEFEFDTDVTIQLFDTKGLLILSETNNRYVKGSKGKTTFDLSRIANQMFYVKLTTSQGSVTKKIVSSSPNRR